MQAETAGAGHPERTLVMVEQGLDGTKGLAAIVGAIERGGIGAREYDIAADERRGLERPHRIQRESGASRKFHVAVFGLMPARAEIIRPAHERAPMHAHVAHKDARRSLVWKIRRRENRLTFEIRTRDAEIAALAIAAENEYALDGSDDHDLVAAVWRDRICVFALHRCLHDASAAI